MPHIHQHSSKHIAAIASKLAAELFNLENNCSHIQTMKNNYTRFCIAIMTAEPVANANKASVNFHTDHSKGSLARVLTKIAEDDVNLAKVKLSIRQ